VYTTSANGCSGGAQNVSVTVNPTPVLSSTLTASRCSNISATYTATSTTAGAAFSWTRSVVAGISNAAGSASTAAATETLINTTSSPVTVSYVYTILANGCSNTQTVSMTVNPSPVLSSTLSPSAICSGSTFGYTATSATSGTTFAWTRAAVPGISNAAGSGTGNVSEVLTNTASSSVNVTYVYTLTANSCSGTPQSVVVAVESKPVIQTQPSNQSVCALGNSVNFTVAATGTSLTYQWKKGASALSDGPVFSGTQTSTLTITGVSASELATYSVVVSGACTPPVTSNSVTLNQSTVATTITTQPVSITDCVGADFTFSIAATGATLTYQWQKNSVNLSDGGSVSGVHTSALTIANGQISDIGAYKCIVSSSCAADVTSSTANLTASVCTSIQSAQAQGFRVMPNPSAGSFRLTNDYAPFNVSEIELVSPQGVTVLNKSVSGGLQVNEWINVQDLASGMYLLIIKGEGQQALVKIAIEK